MVYAPLVGPIVGLALWTFAIEGWMYAYRIPDLTTYKVDVNPNLTREEMGKNIPRHRQFPADNFAHLHEQPTVFYAVALALQFLEATDSLTVSLAWTYVGVRIVHSLVQATTNPIRIRFQCFLLSSFVLLGMSVRAAVLAYGA